MENKFLDKCIKIYFFFTIVLIITIKYGYLYLSTGIGIVLGLLVILNNQGHKVNNIRENKLVKIYRLIIFMYIGYLLILPILLGDIKFIDYIYVINKVTPFILLIVLSKYLNSSPIKLAKNRIIVTRFFIIGIIITLVLFLFGVAYIEIGSGIRLVTIKENLMLHNEYRVSGFLSHKSRMGIYCILAVGMIKCNVSSTKVKMIMYASTVGVAFLTDSLTTFIGLVFVIIFPFLINQIKLFIANLYNRQINFANIFILINSVFISVLGLFVFIKDYSEIFGVRDFSTLGSRTQIWSLGINYLKSNPYGISKISDNFKLSDSAIFVNGHNLFLNEFIESGYIGGILFIIICILTIFVISNSEIRLIFIVVLAVSQFDMMIYNEIPYILWGIMTLYINSNNAKSRVVA